MTFKPKMQHMIDSFEGMGLVALHKTEAELIAKRGELDRKLAAIRRAMRNVRKAGRLVNEDASPSRREMQG